MKAEWRRGLRRFFAFFRKEPLDQELDAELASHLQMAEDDLISQGLSPEEARRQARIDLGGLGAVREHHRDVRSLPFLDTLQQDVRLAWRTLLRDRGFTTVAVLVLALSLGATATVYSVVDGILLEPLPLYEPDRLTWITNGPELPGAGLSGITSTSAVFQEWRERNRSFEAMTAYFAFFSFNRRELELSDGALRLTGVGVEKDFFSILGVPMYLGRSFVDDEAVESGPPAVILGHSLWRNRLGANRGIIGQAVQLDGEPVTVVGVLPPSFDFASIFAPGSQVDLFTALDLRQIEPWGNTVSVLGRLRPGVQVEQAQEEMLQITERMQEEMPELGLGYGAHVTSLKEKTGRSSRQGLFFLLACVGAVLAIASANIAGLQLARAANRRQEFAVRTALGAGKGRLVRQLLTEGLVLASISAVLGGGLAYLAVRLIARLPHTSLPLLERVELDGGSFLCIAATTLLVGVVCGLTPVVQASFPRLQEALRDAARGSTGGGWQARARSGLVVAETALACMLLIAASLLIRSFSQLLDVDLGFEPRQALTLNVEPDAQMESVEDVDAFFQRLRLSLKRQPDVTSVGLSDALPLSHNRSWQVFPQGQVFADGEPRPSAFASRVDEHYFEAMGIELIKGRGFTHEEAWQNAEVVIVNESLAESFWPGEDPIGKVMTIGLSERSVLGVARRVHHKGVDSATGFDAYVPIGLQDGSNSLDMVIRTDRAPAEAAAGVRSALLAADATLPTDDLRPLAWLVDRAVSPRRFVASLLGGFALFAVLLACLGIYGVIAYTTGRRSREIGVRMALGATSGDVQRSVLKDTLALSGAGVLLGTLGGFGLAYAMRSLLFEVSPADPASFVVMLVGMVLVTLAAGSIPARRAAQIEPSSTLRAG